MYREAGLLIRQRKRKRLLRAGFVRPVVTGANQEWAVDFVHDAAESGRKFREEYNEERPHSSLGYVAPREFARRVAALRSPTPACAPQLEQQKQEELTGEEVT